MSCLPAGVRFVKCPGATLPEIGLVFSNPPKVRKIGFFRCATLREIPSASFCKSAASPQQLVRVAATSRQKRLPFVPRLRRPVTSQSNLQTLRAGPHSDAFEIVSYGPGFARRRKSEAELLVVKAIHSVEAGCVTTSSIRAAVLDRLVQIQVSSLLCSSNIINSSPRQLV